MQPLLIIIHGLPCTGKTSLARYLSAQLAIPSFSKDCIKEIIFDNLGWSDRIWSKKVSLAGNRILLHIAEKLLATGKSLIIDSNFNAEADTPRITELVTRFAAQSVQCHCKADPHVITARFLQRVETASRHPGHMDSIYRPELEQLLAHQPRPLMLPGILFELDTNVEGKIDYEDLLAQIKLTGLA